MRSDMQMRELAATFGVLAGLLSGGCSGLEKRSTTASAAKDTPAVTKTAEKAKADSTAEMASTKSAVPTKSALPAKSPTESAAVKPVKAVADAKSGRTPRERLEEVGSRLAAASSDTGMKFQFDSLYNPRPKTHHWADGRIYITTGMIEELKTPDDLAAVLALEMAQLLAEKKAGGSGSEIVKASMPSTGPGDQFRDHALAAKIATQSIRPEDVRASAQQILDKAGFRSANVAAVREKIQRFAAKPETPTPRDPRLRQVFAN